MSAGLVIAFFALGGAAGAAHFLMLKRTAGLFTRGGGALAALALQAGRMLATGAVLTLAALSGWPSLLACAAGVLLARAVVLRLAARAPP